ncbi:MAG: stage III sporulation protein AE [Bacillota bacterium]
MILKRCKKNRIKLAVAAVLFIVLAPACPCAAAGGWQDEQSTADMSTRIIERQIETSGVNTIKEGLLEYADDESIELLEGFSADELINNLAGGDIGFDPKGFADKALKYFFNEIFLNIGILVKLSALVVICALLKNLGSNFNNEGVGEIAFHACYIMTISVLLAGFGTAVRMGTDIIGRMVGFMYAVIPVIFALLISAGNITAGGILHPVLLMVIEASATIIKGFFVPLVFLSTILSIVNNISEKVQVARMASLVKQIVSWSLGLLLTGFVVIILLQGSIGAVIDGAASKAAKFAVSAFVPVVGKTLADAADTVLGCTLLVKNAAGSAVMIGILAICIAPMLKIMAMVVLYKVAGALLEPISESRITNCINDVAGSMLQIFAMTAAVAFMFVILVTAIVSAGNKSAMLR